jgi:hypothetical protein
MSKKNKHGSMSSSFFNTGSESNSNLLSSMKTRRRGFMASPSMKKTKDSLNLT